MDDNLLSQTHQIEGSSLTERTKHLRERHHVAQGRQNSAHISRHNELVYEEFEDFRPSLPNENIRTTPRAYPITQALLSSSIYQRSTKANSRDPAPGITSSRNKFEKVRLQDIVTEDLDAPEDIEFPNTSITPLSKGPHPRPMDDSAATVDFDTDEQPWPVITNNDLPEVTLQNISSLDPWLQRSLLLAAQQYLTAPAKAPHLGVGRDPQLSSKISRRKNGAFPSETDPRSYCCDVSRSIASLRQLGNYYCHGCRVIFSERCRCWNGQLAHSAGSENPGHEKISLPVAKLVHETLTAECEDGEQAMTHLLDSSCLWFGAGFENDGTAVFRDFGRYASLMSERANAQRRPCFPALVAFVGETGAGKSSLIKLLIGMYATDENPKTPVVGTSASSDTPTSGDVHLYGDPQTFNTSDPILYADCEGLNGGSRVPIGTMYRNRKLAANDARRTQTSSLRKHLRRKHDPAARELIWANTLEKKSRSYFVHNLYPRLLYTFSDVIVFVMKNARVIEDVIEQLITWAEAVLEASSNQPVLPHAVIVLNASDNFASAVWDVKETTDALLKSVQQVVKTNEKLRKCAESWRFRGVQPDSSEALLLSYYSSIRVIRVPEKSHTSLVYQQIQVLYKEISEVSRQSLEHKSNLRMKLSSEELQPYLQSAFDHFSRTLERPFDFVGASYAKSNIPSDFGGNILKLAINMMDLWKNRLSGSLLFTQLSFMLASCAMLDAVRKGILGGAAGIVSHYHKHFDEALEDFCDRHWPCEFVSRGGRCVNVKAGHSKGHQLYDGQIVDTGPYESSLSVASYRKEMLDSIFELLQELLHRLSIRKRELSLEEGEAASLIHRDLVMRYFYKQLGDASNFISHSTCLSCLVFPPQHCLPCGHIICTPCVEDYGRRLGFTAYEMEECPLHDGPGFSPPWKIGLHPASAGVRILTLDGGGIRGIVELTSLQHIENELGGDLRIQSFFDLIVGTSTGAIIALGLGEKGWSVNKCIQKFEELSSSIFIDHKKTAVEFFNNLITASNGGRYKTEPLEKILMDLFGPECLFGGSKEQQTQSDYVRVKVAVTTTSIDGIPHVLANYNRHDSRDEDGYEFLRAETPSLEIKTWQAARSSSAAPRIFRPFDHVATGKSFLDGGIYHNNPIEIAMREFRLLFPENGERPPDILVSLGAAFGTSKPKRSTPKTPTAPYKGALSYYRTLMKIASDHVQHSLNSEQKWNEFIAKIDTDSRSRFSRINFELQGQCPKLDDVASMSRLRSSANFWLTEHNSLIRGVADRLIATSFYFELAHVPIRKEDGSLKVTGSIECRFPSGSPEIVALGKLFMKRNRLLLKSSTQRSHHFCFLIEEDRREQDARPIYITDYNIIEMRNYGVFYLEEFSFVIKNPLADIDIHLRFGWEADHAENNSISGFPRCWEIERTPQLNRPPSLSKKRALSSKAGKPVWSQPLVTRDRDTLAAFAKQELPGLATERELLAVSQRLSQRRDYNETDMSDAVRHTGMPELPAQVPGELWSTEIASTIQNKLDTSADDPSEDLVSRPLCQSANEDDSSRLMPASIYEDSLDQEILTALQSCSIGPEQLAQMNIFELPADRMTPTLSDTDPVTSTPNSITPTLSYVRPMQKGSRQAPLMPSSTQSKLFDLPTGEISPMSANPYDTSDTPVSAMRTISVRQAKARRDACVKDSLSVDDHAGMVCNSAIDDTEDLPNDLATSIDHAEERVTSVPRILVEQSITLQVEKAVQTEGHRPQPHLGATTEVASRFRTSETDKQNHSTTQRQSADSSETDNSEWESDNDAKQTTAETIRSGPWSFIGTTRQLIQSLWSSSQSAQEGHNDDSTTSVEKPAGSTAIPKVICTRKQVTKQSARRKLIAKRSRTSK